MAQTDMCVRPFYFPRSSAVDQCLHAAKQNQPPLPIPHDLLRGTQIFHAPNSQGDRCLWTEAQQIEIE